MGTIMRRHAAALLLVSPLSMSVARAETPTPSFVHNSTVSICMDPTFPPMEYMEQAGAREPSGLDVDLARALVLTWKARPQIVTMDFTGLLPGLAAKRCDLVISGATLTEERQKSFDGVPYLKTGKVVIGRADSTLSVSGYESLGGKPVAVQAGTTFVDDLNAANQRLAAASKPLITIQSYPKGTDVIQQILNGRAAAGITLDSEFAWREIQAPGQLKILWPDPRKDQFAAYLRKDPEDAAALRAAVREVASSGALARLAAQYKLPSGAAEGFDH